MRIVSETSESICVAIPGDSALPNQLRWALNRDIPVDGINQVCIIENTSPFPDQFIAHRLCLVPLRCLGDDCKKEISLSVRADSGVRRVMTSDIIGGYEAMKPDIILASLPETTSLTFKANVETGVGRTHQRFNHVSACRIEQRHVGMDPTKHECWCCDTPYNSRCVECVGYKPSKQCVLGDIEHFLAFETMGPISPKESLAIALHATYMKLQKVKAVCESK